MALAVTAPVAVAHSGEQDPAQTPQLSMGAAFPDIVGTSDTAAGNINVHIFADEANVDVTVTVVAAASAFTTAGKLTYIANAPGMYTVEVLDVTSGNKVTTKIEVFASEGV